MNTDKWCFWHQSDNDFQFTKIPTLTKRFAGIGSRFLPLNGIQAIVDVYNTTFKQ